MPAKEIISCFCIAWHMMMASCHTGGCGQWHTYAVLIGMLIFENFISRYKKFKSRDSSSTQNLTAALRRGRRTKGKCCNTEDITPSSQVGRRPMGSAATVEGAAESNYKACLSLPAMYSCHVRPDGQMRTDSCHPVPKNEQPGPVSLAYFSSLYHKISKILQHNATLIWSSCVPWSMSPFSI